MSSPSVRKLSSSPIRNLDNNSPRKIHKLQTILEEPAYVSRPSLLNNLMIERQNTSLNLQNEVLNNKIRNYAEQTTKYLVENSRLKQQNQILLNRTYRSNTIQVQKLSHQILLKEAQTQKLRTDVQLLKTGYDRNVDRYLLQNQALRNQLQALQAQKIMQVEQVKQKCLALSQRDLNLTRKQYYDDIQKLSSNLQATKAILSQKQLQIKHLTNHGHNLVRQHSAYLEQLVSQNNVLRNRIIEVQIKKENQVKQASAMKQLEKSRTHGIIAFCKESNSFLEKQVSKLAEQLLQKSISIEQFTKDITKVKRNLQQTEKRYEQKIMKVETDCDEKIRQIQKQLQKQERYHKQQLAQAKKRQMQLQQVISTKDHQYQVLARENEHNKQIIKARQQQIQALKANVSRMHEDHAKQISKVMTDSRVKRKSMKNLSSSSSLRDLSASSGSQILKKVQRSNSIHQDQPQNQSRQLYTVHQEMAASQLVHNEEDEEDVQMKQLVLHYEGIIQQLKNNKLLELNMANQKIQKLNLNLREKQQEVLQILQRFSPLMEYKLSSTSIETQRKQKIQKHYNANIDLLSVMLDKYGIAALSKK